MALRSTMTSASKPLAAEAAGRRYEDILLLDAAKKDSTGTLPTPALLLLQPLFAEPLQPGGCEDPEVPSRDALNL
jgi:hypothetical protein